MRPSHRDWLRWHHGSFAQLSLDLRLVELLIGDIAVQGAWKSQAFPLQLRRGFHRRALALARGADCGKIAAGIGQSGIMGGQLGEEFAQPNLAAAEAAADAHGLKLDQLAIASAAALAAPSPQGGDG
jgi:hypothetical protein